MNIPKSGWFYAFSVIVDINSSVKLVAENTLPGGIADYMADVLGGAITAIEKSGGSVIGIMGDAIFGIVDTADAVVVACATIAKDVNRQREYLTGTDYESAVPTLPGLKIGVEYGQLNVSKISSNAMGELPFCIGGGTNYAARIADAGVGNRCNIGPDAMKAGLDQYIIDDGPGWIEGKSGEGTYTYWKLDLSDIWIEGDDSEKEFW